MKSIVRSFLLGLCLGIESLGPGCRSQQEEAPLTAATDRSAAVQATLAAAGQANLRGDLFKTAALLREAYAGARDDPDIALDLGDTLNRLQHNEAAREHYREFLSRHPSASQVRLAFGLTLMALGRWEESAGELRKTVASLPEDAGARLNLGRVLGRLGRDAEALPHLEAAADLSPEDAEAHARLGITYERLGRIPEATAELERAVALDPGNVPALFNLGSCYARAGRTAEAAETLDRFNRASHRTERYIDEKRLFRAAQARAYELSEAGRNERALEALLAYRESLDEFPPFHQELGVAYLRLGRTREARAAFEKAVAMDPSLTESHAHLRVLARPVGEAEEPAREREAAVQREEASRPPRGP